MSESLTVPPAIDPNAPELHEPVDPLVALLERMERISNGLPEESRGMTEDIAKLLAASREPGAATDPAFRTQVAYLLQDWPKFSGSRLALVIEPGMQGEMRNLALSYPGLESTRIQSLMRETARLTDRSLIGDIRTAAAEVASLGGGPRQGGLMVSELSKSLEYRLLEASIGTTATPPEAQQTRTVERTASPSTSTIATPDPSSDIDNRIGITANQASGGLDTRIQVHGAAEEFPTKPSAEPTEEAGQTSTATSTKASSKVTTGTPVPNALPPGPGHILGERLMDFGRRMGERKVQDATAIADRAGVAAVDALERFITGPGRELGNKIDAAARHEARGVEAVIEQMTPTGRHSGLRREVDEKLKADPAFANAYEDVVRTTGLYARKRDFARAEAAERGIDYTKYDQEATNSDAKIGDAVGRIPGREAGTSVMKELGVKAAALFARAMEALKVLLSKDMGVEVKAGASPSPG